MTEDDVIYHLGRIERMRKSIEQKIQTLTLDNADDAREGFRLIEEEADTLEKDRVQALMSIAEGASFEVVYPGRGYSSARSLGLDIDFEGALSTIQIEAEDICSTAGEAADALEEMEGEEGDEVQGVVEDYLGTIDTSNDAIYKAVGEIKQGLPVGVSGPSKKHRDATVPFFLRADRKKAAKKKPSQGFLRSLEKKYPTSK